MDKLFLILLLSHFIGDYLLHMNSLSVKKRSPEPLDMFVANLTHAWIHLLCVLIILFFTSLTMEEWIRVCALVFLAHFSIDFVRCVAEIELFNFEPMVIGPRKALLMFLRGDVTGIKMDFKYIISAIVDQLVHVGSLYWISQL